MYIYIRLKIKIYKEYENNEKCNDEIYQLAKDQALVKKLKNNKRFRPFCLCPPDVMFVTRVSKNSLFLSLILSPTWIVVYDINFGSTKVIQ
jgi:hypothetical protein